MCLRTISKFSVVRYFRRRQLRNKSEIISGDYDSIGGNDGSNGRGDNDGSGGNDTAETTAAEEAVTAVADFGQDDSVPMTPCN